MSDHSPETESNETSSPSTSSSGQSSASLDVGHLVSLCAIGLLVSFFLPWIKILFIRGSGFDLAKQGGVALALWVIPAFSLVTLLAGMAKQSQKAISQFTGLLPFLFLILEVHDAGTDILKTFDYGAYASLAMGLGLIVLPSRLK